MKKKKAELFSIVRFSFLLGLILLTFGLGIHFGKSMVLCPICTPSDVDFSLFWETWQVLEDRYVDSDKLDIQEMIYGAISGMLEALDDPYTVFLDPEQSRIFNEDISGEFEGVGAEIGIREGRLQIIAPLENTPAQKAGLRTGDIILKIDDTFSADITIDEAVSLIRGPKGTEVTLTILREEEREEREIKVIRDTIEIPSLKWELIEGDIAYIKIYHFTQKASSDFNKIGLEILSSPAQKIIIDVRNNPGGYLDIAQYITGWFLEEGQFVAIEERGDGFQELHEAQGGQLAGYPVVCLINKGSASASEILAGALRDNRNVIIIGEQSFGKGTVQELTPLRDGSHLKLTIAKWLTPKGTSISEVGISPDIEIELTEEDYDQGRDPQLDKAIEIIKGL